MRIIQNNLKDLYKRLTIFISSNYPEAIIVENDSNVIITYPGEMGRIAILQDSKQENLLVSILLNIGEQISNNNTKTFYLSTIDEFNCLKTGIQIAMEMVNSNSGKSIEKIKTASNGQGYLLDSDKNTLGVVDLSLIPTNAFIRNTDSINQKDISLSSMEAPQEEKTIRKFFKR